VKHPFVTGLVTGLAGLFLWNKRHWLMGLVHPAAAMHGFGGTVDLARAAGVAVRHIQRYTFAAMQDQSPIVGLTHASYALNGLDMLEEAGGGEAVRAMGFSPGKVRALISAIQDKHAKALHAADPYITQVLGMREGYEFGVGGAGAAPNGA
jgi:hypothetical protein